MKILERPRDQCGVFAMHHHNGGPHTAAQAVYLGLLALQHRGQESAGLAFPGAAGIQCRKGMGLVSQVFPREWLAEVTSATALGHVRYSTTGISNINNAQPLVARSTGGYGIALAHNGNLSNNDQLKQALLEEGHIFHATTDTETLLAYLFRFRKKGLAAAAAEIMQIVEGAYAAVAMDYEQMIAFRDPFGFRPLVMGRLGKAVVFASETCALESVGAVFERELLPGEIVSAARGEVISTAVYPAAREAFCIFEFIYFARPDSTFQGQNVHLVRKAVGARLARRVVPGLEMVIPSPDSGVSAAMGMAEAARLPLEWAIHRNPYRGRTFIEPSPEGREQAARLKYNPIAALVKGKRVAVVDDSLVRGTTARKLTALLREAGAAAVHLFIAAPPYTHPCYYGVDIPVAAGLAAVEEDAEQRKLAASIGADSITYATLDDLYSAVGHNQSGYCTACFTGDYPTG
ncbi:MAG: amidophosphoribosyltransferase [Bacillota bacterium]